MEAIAWIALSVLSVFIAKAVDRQQCSRLLAFTSCLLLFFGVSILALAFHIAPPFTIFVCVISGILLFVFGFFSLLDMTGMDRKDRCSVKEYEKEKKDLARRNKF